MQNIKPDMPVFLHDGEHAVGAVRHAPHDGHPDLVIYVENAGDFLVHPDAVVDVHFDKVLLNPDKLDDRLCNAIGHRRDSEDDQDHLPVEER